MAGGDPQARATDHDPRAYAGREQTSSMRTTQVRAQNGVFARPQPSLPALTLTMQTGSRTYAIHPSLWIGSAVIAATLALGGIASGLYVAFHDNILEIAINRPIRMEQAYEDRIAALRSEIDRINSRQLLDQDAFEGKLTQLMTRQDELRADESRVSGLLAKAGNQTVRLANGANLGVVPAQLGGDLISPTTTSSIAASPAPPASSQTQPVPHPIDEPPLRSSWLFGSGLFRSSGRLNDRTGPAAQIARVSDELDRMQTAQMASLTAITGIAETNSRKIERVVERLGLRIAEADVPRPPQSAAQARAADTAKPVDPTRGVGGPLVPIMDEHEILSRAEAALTRLGQLKEGINLLPLGQPISGQIEVTSPFGERPDPFLGTLAMHTGTDMRAGYGDPVVATAGGTVTEASRQGGYGKVVEVDHGNGLSTRYGHLSQFAVVVGQKIKAGHIIGYVGSTGRSTAPHLHYETRVNGVAVNPEAYLQAGNQLRPILLN